MSPVRTRQVGTWFLFGANSREIRSVDELQVTTPQGGEATDITLDRTGTYDKPLQALPTDCLQSMLNGNMGLFSLSAIDG